MCAHPFQIMKILLVSLLGIFSFVLTKDWGDPPFTAIKDERFNVTIETKYDRATVQIIETVTYADFLILDYKLDEPPPFSYGTGSKKYLIIEHIKRDDGKWVARIQNSLDYEVIYSTLLQYSYSLDLEGYSPEFSIQIRVHNIDDEDPTVDQPAECQLKENTTEGSCLFSVIDKDGTDYPNFDFHFDDSSLAEKIDEIFEFKPASDPMTDTKRDYNLVLKTPLDFEQKMYYLFKYSVTDSGGNKSPPYSVRVKVVDIPDELPFWVTSVLDTYEILEQETKTIQFLARDGDLEYNAPCTYKIELDNNDYNIYFDMNKESGLLTIDAPDREGDGIPASFPSKIIANDGDQTLSTDVVFHLQDKNDNPPRISDLKDTSFSKNEQEIFSFTFNVDDEDEIINAYYNIELVDIGEKTDTCTNWRSAFSVFPSMGSKKNLIEVLVIKPDVLNYDKPVFCTKVHFNLTVKEKDYQEGGYLDFREINIDIKNRWDEPPIFLNTPYTVNVNESIKINELLDKNFKIEFDDYDTDDKVGLEIHSDFLKINDDGSITVTKENAFNFEYLQSLSVQVTATDRGLLKTSTLISIQVLDVNDERPTMIMPRNSPTSYENAKKDYILSGEIIGNDQDQNANLEFSILWEESDALKMSSILEDKSIFQGCLDIKYHKEDRGWVAQLIVTGTPQLNYEDFDMLSLTINVIDTNTDPDYIDTSSSYKDKLYVRIIDVDDTSPVFSPETKDAKFRVEENSINQIIGKLVATDVDSPKIFYSFDSSEDLKKLIKLDENTGEIIAAWDGKDENVIDYETYHYINYTMIVTDKINPSTSLELSIEVIDKNDCPPEPKDPLEKTINEDFKGLISKIEYTDNDTREPFKTAWFILNDNKESFELDPNTGELKIKEDSNLDCKDGDFRNLNIILKDNFQDSYKIVQNDQSIETKITFKVNLVDVNNHKPELDNNNKMYSIMETTKKGTLVAELTYTDDDKGANSEADLILTKISQKDGTVVEGYFILDEKNKIMTNIDSFIDKWGIYQIEITLTDRGNPPLTNTGIINVEVKDENQPPRLIFPSKEKGLEDYIILLEQTPGSRLRVRDKDGNDKTLPDFTAEDNDEGSKGQLEFTIEVKPNSFEIKKMDDKSAYLTFKENGENKVLFEAKLLVKDGEGLNDSLSFSIKMELGNVPPEFSPQTGSITIKENQEGLDNSPYPLPVNATDQNIENGKKEHIYYMIIGGSDLFAFKNNLLPNLHLLSELDYEKEKSYEIQILASNSATPTDRPEQSVFTLKIEVENVNDCFPEFSEPLYLAPVEVNDKNGKKIATILAIDQDEGDSVTYEKGDITVSDSSLNIIKERSAISIDEVTGDVTINFDPDGKMKGFITVTLYAFDEVRHRNESILKIYVVSDSDRMKFTFTNSKDEVTLKKTYIEQTFTNAVEFSCTIDTINRAVDENQVAQDSITYIITYFIDVDSNVVKSAESIKRILNNMATMEKIKNILSREGLILFSLENVNKEDDNTKDILQTTLIVVSVVLGVLLIILFLGFFFRTRSLTKRLEALSTTKFGSQNSGINRSGLTVPNTNRHAVEGSNPVWQGEIGPELETISQGSGDTDLIGIEDNPEFIYNMKANEMNGFESSDPNRTAQSTWGLEGPLGLEGFVTRRGSVNPLASGQMALNYDEEDHKSECSQSVPITEL